MLQKLDWLEREPAVVHEYQAFLVNLVSAHTVYLRATLRALIKAFAPSKSGFCKEHAHILAEGTEIHTTALFV